MGKKVADLTDAFDAKLESLRKARVSTVEIDAAIVVYERVRTAQAICQALLPRASAAVVAALAAEIGAVAQSGQSIQLRDR